MEQLNGPIDDRNSGMFETCGTCSMYALAIDIHYSLYNPQQQHAMCAMIHLIAVTK